LALVNAVGLQRLDDNIACLTLNRPERLNASEPSCMATSAGGRIGSFSTKKLNRSVDVTAPRAAVSTNVSIKALPSRNSRLPSGVYGYFESDSKG